MPVDQLLRERGIPEDTISLLVHSGCSSVDDLQCIDDALLDSLHVHKAFVRKRLLQIKLEHQTPATAQLHTIEQALGSVNILPEKCTAYARLLARDGIDSLDKLALVRDEEDLTAMGIRSLFDVRVIMGLARAMREGGGRVAQPPPPPPQPPQPVVKQTVVAVTPPPPPPHHDTPVYTLVTPYAEGSDSYDELAAISLNILSDANLQSARGSDTRYAHLSNEQCDWAARWRHLRRVLLLHINEGNVDVFCLQECDYSRFHQDIKLFLLRQGFTAWHQWDEEQEGGGSGAMSSQPRNTFGVCTAYRTAKFAQSFRESRSRTMTLGLVRRPNTDSSRVEWFVVNCHLEAHPSKTDKRLAQISSTLFNLSVHAKLDPRRARVVVLGDFNSSRDDASFQWLVNPQQQQQLEEDHAAPPPPHAFRFQDAYRNASEEVYQAMTYADNAVAFRVDHVLFSIDTCAVMETLRIPLLRPESTGKYGVLYGDYPTDHYAVGCILHALPLPVAAADAAEDAGEESGELLTEGQMRVLEFLESGAPVRTTTTRGKPSAVELAAMRAHTQSVNAFLSHLTKPQRAFVAKWRKAQAKEKPVPQQPIAAATTTRSRRYSDDDGVLASLAGLLFADEEDDVAAAAAAKQRRATLQHAKSARF